MERVIMSALPDDMAESDRAAIAAALPLVAPGTVMELMIDAGEARDLLERGDREGAIAIIEKHRQMALDAGMGAMLDAIIDGL